MVQATIASFGFALLSGWVSEIQIVGDLAEDAFRDHYGRVYRFVRSRTTSEAEAEEIAQTVFAEAAARLDGFKPGSSPVLAWLFTVAQRRLIDAARHRHRHERPLSLDQIEVATPEPVYGPDVADALRGALRALPARQRQTVVLRLIEGRSFAEIAERSGSTEAACKMRFARGIASVRACLEREGIVP